MTNTYNGWTNYETWLVNLWYDGFFQEDAEEFSKDDVHGLVERIQETVTENAHMEIAGKSGLVTDLINSALSEVNWHEIAEHYLEG